MVMSNPVEQFLNHVQGDSKGCACASCRNFLDQLEQTARRLWNKRPFSSQQNTAFFHAMVHGGELIVEDREYGYRTRPVVCYVSNVSTTDYVTFRIVDDEQRRRIQESIDRELQSRKCEHCLGSNPDCVDVMASNASSGRSTYEGSPSRALIHGSTPERTYHVHSRFAELIRCARFLLHFNDHTNRFHNALRISSSTAVPYSATITARQYLVDLTDRYKQSKLRLETFVNVPHRSR